MTPFGIRKRLKSLLGMSGDEPSVKLQPRREIPKVTLTLVDADGNEETLQCEQGSTITFGSGNAARPLGTGCSDATCATCRCEVLEGAEHLSEQTGKERATLKENGFDTSWRLGCQTEITGGAVKIRGHEWVEM